ncbi:MAG: carbon storage regulator CsrA [Planctomycetaceae bacterium]
MLVLSRKQDEKIIIGDSITLMVVSIQGDKVRLGIEAPKHVSIHREEVYRAIHKDAEKTQVGNEQSELH